MLLDVLDEVLLDVELDEPDATTVDELEDELPEVVETLDVLLLEPLVVEELDQEASAVLLEDVLAELVDDSLDSLADDSLAALCDDSVDTLGEDHEELDVVLLLVEDVETSVLVDVVLRLLSEVTDAVEAVDDEKLLSDSVDLELDDVEEDDDRLTSAVEVLDVLLDDSLRSWMSLTHSHSVSTHVPAWAPNSIVCISVTRPPFITSYWPTRMRAPLKHENE